MDFFEPLSFNTKITDPNDPNIVLSPLADPVAGAIFANAEVAGLASESFINAVHKSENESGMKGKVIRVTPQFSSVSATTRGCRVDVETETDANEYYRYEIEIAPNVMIMVRDIFSASHLFVGMSTKGDTAAQMAKKMPNVIYINILGYNLRKTNTEMVQPAKFMYTKPPQEEAVDKIKIYNIQLPRIAEMKQDFSDDLYCWCYTLYTAHIENKTVKEVVSMNPALQEYAKRDTGFQQFCDRHETVSADPQIRHEYVSWYLEKWREEDIINTATQTGYEKGYGEADKKRITDLAQAEQKQKSELLNAARNMKNAGVPIELIVSSFPLTKEEMSNL